MRARRWRCDGAFVWAKKGIPSIISPRKHVGVGTVSILLSSLLLVLLFLAWERRGLSRTRRRIPLVIAVTGTRGKSSVARSLGAVLQASGRRVLVKTTGTEARFVLPDGSVEEVRRRGAPTILEQKAVLRKAARYGVEVLVAEIMSIEPENHFVESQRILRPDIVVITNVRPDHREEMGRTVEEIAETMRLTIVPGCRVFVPQDQMQLFNPSHEATWHAIRTTDATSAINAAVPGRFLENESLVAAVARSLSVEHQAIRVGLGASAPERGDFTIWRYSRDGKTVFLVNAFAANDPESTFLLLERSRALLGRDVKIHGMFAIRSDRWDRTVQWVEALRSDRWSLLEEVFLVGDGPGAISRKIQRSSVLTGKHPALITENAVARMEDGSILFGFGNTHGTGLRLVDYWTKEGTLHGT